jgi:hypothetical protein
MDDVERRAEAAVQDLKRVIEFVEDNPRVVGPAEETWSVVIRATALMDDLDYFSCSLDADGAAEMFADAEDDDAEDDAEDDGPVKVAQSLAGYLREMAATVDAHPDVAMLDNWISGIHKLMGVEDGGWVAVD